jgi:hypothetical protein
MEVLKLAGVIVLAAGAGEGIIEFIPAPIVRALWPGEGEKQNNIRTIILNTLSALLGVAIALNFQLSAFSLLGAEGNMVWVGQVVTGVLLGRGSNYIHAFIKRFVIDNELKAEELRIERSM